MQACSRAASGASWKFRAPSSWIPEVLLVDEPSIGLEPRFIDMVFDLLGALRREGKTIVMVEQNAKKGLEFADIGYVLVNGEVEMAGTGKALLDDPSVGRLFLGG